MLTFIFGMLMGVFGTVFTMALMAMAGDDEGDDENE